MPVPFWVIRNIVYPTGARQPQFKVIDDKRLRCANDWCKKDISGMKSACYIPIREAWICAECNEKRNSYILPPVTGSYEGNLQNWEYRFWVGSQMRVAVYACCRVCNKGTYNYQERMEHKTALEPSCIKRLIEAAKILDKRGICIVCKKGTPKRPWGWPLCGDDCKRAWMFEKTTAWILVEEALQCEKLMRSGSNKT